MARRLQRFFQEICRSSIRLNDKRLRWLLDVGNTDLSRFSKEGFRLSFFALR